MVPSVKNNEKEETFANKDPNIKKERKKYSLEESLSHAHLSFSLYVFFSFFFFVGQARKVNYGQSR